jgi:hypothetical protein
MQKLVFGTLTVAGILAFSVATASAAYVCSGDVCWIAKEKYTYPAEAKVIVREESWKPTTSVTIKDAGSGRGYYKAGVWTTW